MDLKNFKESTRPAVGKASALHREWTRVRSWFLPPTNDKRKQRFDQYRDLALCAGAVLAVAYFEERIGQLF